MNYPSDASKASDGLYERNTVFAPKGARPLETVIVCRD